MTIGIRNDTEIDRSYVKLSLVNEDFIRMEKQLLGHLESSWEMHGAEGFEFSPIDTRDTVTLLDITQFY